MNTTLTIPAAERGHLRLFAVNLTDTSALDTDTALAQFFGEQDLDMTYVELVKISDLDELSLPDYLTQGYDIDTATLAPDRARLSALGGYVLVILSLAFKDRAITLAPRPELTLIATYTTHGPDWSSTQTLDTDSTKIGSGVQRKKPSEAAMMGRIATYVLLFMFVFTALFVWMAA